VAEGARLESVFTGNRNVGSNPTPSAKKAHFCSISASFFPYLQMSLRYGSRCPRALRRRGGGRVVYYVALGTDRFYMMAAYPKSEWDDLSTEQRRRILVALESIRKPGI
jgi:hypothetical protein